MQSIRSSIARSSALLRNGSMRSMSTTATARAPDAPDTRNTPGFNAEAPDSTMDSKPYSDQPAGSGDPTQKSTGMGESHATNTKDSVVPEPLQKAVPETVERVLPEAVHPTGDGKK